jgi:hypothetical protein
MREGTGDAKNSGVRVVRFRFRPTATWLPAPCIEVSRTNHSPHDTGTGAPNLGMQIRLQEEFRDEKARAELDYSPRFLHFPNTANTDLV